MWLSNQKPASRPCDRHTSLTRSFGTAAGFIHTIIHMHNHNLWHIQNIFRFIFKHFYFMCVLRTLFSQIPEGSDLLILPEQQKHHISCFMLESAVGKTEREKTENCHVSLFAKSSITIKYKCMWSSEKSTWQNDVHGIS